MTPVAGSLASLLLLVVPVSHAPGVPPDRSVTVTQTVVRSVRAAARHEISTPLPSPSGWSDAAARAAFRDRIAGVGAQTSRSATRGEPLGTFLATCYSLGGTTASGAPTSLRVVAVDPHVVPLGTRLFIEGVGVRTALDTGGAIRGRRIDVWLPTTRDCRAFGARRLEVWRA